MWSTRSPAVLVHRACASRMANGGKLRMLLLAHGGFSQFLGSYRFLYKNSPAPSLPSVLLTAHQIPRTVFLPYPAYFYSFGHFILGLRMAYFGSVDTYCFISGCLAFVRVLESSSGCGQMCLRGAGLLPKCVCARVCLTPHCRARPPGWVSS